MWDSFVFGEKDILCLFSTLFCGEGVDLLWNDGSMETDDATGNFLFFCIDGLLHMFYDDFDFAILHSLCV